MRILIVDDDAMVIESCRRILEADGVSVRVAENAMEARKILDEGTTFELMLTDIKMPSQDGFQLISNIKQTWPDMAVLMMTGYLTPETIDRGKSGGAHGFIAKPFTPDELITAIHKTLKHKAQ